MQNLRPKSIFLGVLLSLFIFGAMMPRFTAADTPGNWIYADQIEVVYAGSFSGNTFNMTSIYLKQPGDLFKVVDVMSIPGYGQSIAYTAYVNTTTRIMSNFSQSGMPLFHSSGQPDLLWQFVDLEIGDEFTFFSGLNIFLIGFENVSTPAGNFTCWKGTSSPAPGFVYYDTKCGFLVKIAIENYLNVELKNATIPCIDPNAPTTEIPFFDQVKDYAITFGPWTGGGLVVGLVLGLVIRGKGSASKPKKKK
jgi:hypothetical protein